MRMMRILKMVRLFSGAELLVRALDASRAKVTVFFSTKLAITVICRTRDSAAGAGRRWRKNPSKSIAVHRIVNTSCLPPAVSLPMLGRQVDKGGAA